MPKLRSRQPERKLTLRERFDNFVLPRVFGRHMSEVVDMVNILEDAYDRGGLLMPPEEVIRKLEESGQLVDLIMRTRGRAFGLTHELTERDRDSAVEQATWMFDRNINIERAVRMWTDFGLGERVDIRAENARANKVLDEFWNAIRNSAIIGQRHLHERSEDVLNEGELALIFWYSTIDGTSTIRKMSTLGLRIIWEDPLDKTIPMIYLRDLGERTLAYRDWRISEEKFQEELAKLNGPVSADEFVPKITINDEDVPVTKHVVLWATRNRNSKLGRGMPQFNNGLEWARVLQDFMGDRAAVARKAAMYTEKVKIEGGSKELNTFKDRTEERLSSNYSGAINPYPAASDWLENTGVTREWMNRNSGATSARYDGRMIAGQLSVNTGVGLHWMGFPDALANRSTAEEILRPFWQQIERYQAWWSSVLEDVGRIVLMLVNDYSAFSVNPETKVIVTLEVPISVEVGTIQVLLSELREQINAGNIPQETALTLIRELSLLALDKLGIRDPEGVYPEASVEDFEPTSPPPIPPIPPEKRDEISNDVIENWRKGLIEDRAVIDYLVHINSD